MGCSLNCKIIFANICKYSLLLKKIRILINQIFKHIEIKNQHTTVKMKNIKSLEDKMKG